MVPLKLLKPQKSKTPKMHPLPRGTFGPCGPGAREDVLPIEGGAQEFSVSDRVSQPQCQSNKPYPGGADSRCKALSAWYKYIWRDGEHNSKTQREAVSRWDILSKQACTVVNHLVRHLPIAAQRGKGLHSVVQLAFSEPLCLA